MAIHKDTMIVLLRETRIPCANGRQVMFRAYGPKRAKVSQKAFENALNRHEQWLNGKLPAGRMEYIGRDLSKIKWDGADLTGAVITECDITGACLRGVNFTDADITWNDFSCSDLHNTNFTDANASHSNFSQADMRWCKFVRTQLTHCLFNNVDARWAEFNEPNLNDSAWLGCNIHGVNMRKFHIMQLHAKDKLVAYRLWSFKEQFIRQLHACSCCSRWDKWNLLPEHERGVVMATPGT